VARPLRLLLPGGVYHVTARGVARAPIVLDDDDRVGFLEQLARVVDRFGLVVHAYCLMTNHFHLLVELLGSGLALTYFATRVQLFRRASCSGSTFAAWRVRCGCSFPVASIT
jgi:hypothetical protein